MVASRSFVAGSACHWLAIAVSWRVWLSSAIAKMMTISLLADAPSVESSGS